MNVYNYVDVCVFWMEFVCVCLYMYIQRTNKRSLSYSKNVDTCVLCLTYNHRIKILKLTINLWHASPKSSEICSHRFWKLATIIAQVKIYVCDKHIKITKAISISLFLMPPTEIAIIL